MRNNGVSYEIQYTNSAEKFFKKHEKIRKKYEESIYSLVVDDHPKQINLKRIKGKRNDYYRILIDDWRVIYAIINGKIIVITTLFAGSRGDIYNKLNRLK